MSHPRSRLRWPGRRAPAGQDGALLRRTRWQLAAWSAGSTLVLLVVLGGGLYLAVAGQLRAESVAKLTDRAALIGQGLTTLEVSGPNLTSGSVETGAADPLGSATSGGPMPGTGRVPLRVASGSDGTTVTPVPAFGIVDVVQDPAQPGMVIGGPVSGTIAQVVGSVGASPLDPGTAIVSRTVVSDGRISEDIVDGVPMRVLVASVQVGGTPGVIQVAEDRSVELGTLQATLMVLLLGGLAAVVAAGLVGYRYSGRALVPIRDSLRRQREFAADASHELRTPLAVIRGNVQILRRDGQLPDAARSAIDDIDAEADRMAALVDQLLLLARTDSDIAEVARQPMDLGQETADTLEPMVRLADAHDVGLELDVAPSPLQGDPLRLRQLVGILVDNAIRHAPRGGHVWVGVTAEHDVARLTVADDGPGVRPEDRMHVFDRFWRAADAPPGGSGLGLAIAAWVVERHGGSIGVDERPGGGARFTVELPAA